MKIKVIRKDGNTLEECTEYEKAQALGGYQEKCLQGHESYVGFDLLM